MRVTVSKPRPQLIGRGEVYRTFSATRELVAHYTFFLQGKDPFCTCEGFNFNEKCRHIKEIMDGDGS